MPWKYFTKKLRFKTFLRIMSFEVKRDSKTMIRTRKWPFWIKRGNFGEFRKKSNFWPEKVNVDRKSQSWPKRSKTSDLNFKIAFRAKLLRETHFMNKMSLLEFRIAIGIIEHDKSELGQKATRKDKENFSGRIFNW